MAILKLPRRRKKKKKEKEMAYNERTEEREWK